MALPIKNLKPLYFIAVILMIVAFCGGVVSVGVPFWYQVYIEGALDPERWRPRLISARLKYLVSGRYGLWELCGNYYNWTHHKEFSECYNMVTHGVDFFRATQAMMLIGILFMLLSIACGVMEAILNMKNMFAVGFSAAGLMGSICMMIAAVVFGLSAPHHILLNYNFPEVIYDELELIRLGHLTTGHLDWGFGVAIAAGVLAVIASVLATVQWGAKRKSRLPQAWVPTGTIRTTGYETSHI